MQRAILSEKAELSGEKGRRATRKNVIRMGDKPRAPSLFHQSNMREELKLFKKQAARSPWLHSCDSYSLSVWCIDTIAWNKGGYKSWPETKKRFYVNQCTILGFDPAGRAKIEFALDKAQKKWEEEHGLARKPRLSNATRLRESQPVFREALNGNANGHVKEGFFEELTE